RPSGRVPRRTGLKPSQRLVAAALHRLDRLRTSVELPDRHGHGLAGGQLREAGHADAVLRAKTVVVARVLESERQDALILEIRLVDAGEALDENHRTAKIPRRHGRVLAARALTIVLVADH